MVAIYADSASYCNYGDGATTGYWSVALWTLNTPYAAGAVVRQKTAPAVGSERVFVCIVAGTSSNTTEPTWTLTRGAKQATDNGVIWQECTGIAGLNGDLTNTATWAQLKAVGTPNLGTVIQRNSGGSLQICTTAGTMAVSEPAFSDTAGVTTNDGTSVWTSLGAPSNYSAWQTPHARLQAAVATNWNPFSANPANLQTTAGNGTIFVGDNHAETQGATMTITPILSFTGMEKIVCCDHTKAPPTAAADLKTTATITTTGAFSITLSGLNGNLYFYGITFSAGSGAVSNIFNIAAGSSFYVFDNCVLKKAGTSGINGGITLAGATAQRILLNNTTVFFGATGDNIYIDTCELIWQNTPGGVLAAGSQVPSHFIGASANGRYSNIFLDALDLNQLNSTTIQGQNASVEMANWIIQNCKLNAGLTVLAIQSTGTNLQFINCDSAATGYTSSRYTFEGTETTETTITRVGGAIDFTGQQQSRKLVSTANALYLRPFRAEPFATWNGRTGANVTLTVRGTVNSASLPNNDELWLEVEYLGTAGFPKGIFDLSTMKANLIAAAAAVATADGSTWNGGGSGVGWTPFKFAITLSSPQPQLAGLIHVRPRVGKATATYYIDPKIDLS